MKSIARRIALPVGISLFALALSSCSGGGGSGAGAIGLPMTPAGPVRNPSSSHARAPHVVITEIAIPPTLGAIPVHPLGGIAVSPDSTVYVSLYMQPYYPYYDIPFIFVGAGYANGGWGAIAVATNASDFVGSGPASGAVATTRDGYAHLAGQHPLTGSSSGFGEAGMTNVGPGGNSGFVLTPELTTGVIPDLAGDSKGNLWYGVSPVPLNSEVFATVNKALHDDLSQNTSVQLSTDFRTSVEALATAPNGDAWVATELANSSRGRRVYHISAAGAIVHTYRLPRGTNIGGVAVAPDNTVWLTDSAGNTIWKLSRRGSFSRYAIPTPASGVDRITVGGDGALWFTEKSADKIGRITTSGHIHEYAVPTPNAAPAGISSLGPGCNPNVIWFEEQSADKIAQITII